MSWGLLGLGLQRRCLAIGTASVPGAAAPPVVWKWGGSGSGSGACGYWEAVALVPRRAGWPATTRAGARQWECGDLWVSGHCVPVLLVLLGQLRSRRPSAEGQTVLAWGPWVRPAAGALAMGPRVCFPGASPGPRSPGLCQTSTHRPAAWPSCPAWGSLWAEPLRNLWSPVAVPLRAKPWVLCRQVGGHVDEPEVAWPLGALVPAVLALTTWAVRAVCWGSQTLRRVP